MEHYEIDRLSLSKNIYVLRKLFLQKLYRTVMNFTLQI
jgi:hypothetical protein